MMAKKMMMKLPILVCAEKPEASFSLPWLGFPPAALRYNNHNIRLLKADMTQLYMYIQ